MSIASPGDTRDKAFRPYERKLPADPTQACSSFVRYSCLEITAASRDPVTPAIDLFTQMFAAFWPKCSVQVFWSRRIYSSPATPEYLAASLVCVQKAAPLACLALAALSACSRQKPISQIELQSKLRSAASIAAEAGTFIDYIGQNRATDQYAKGHVEYLSSELTHRTKDSREALPPAGARHNRGCSSGFLSFSNHSGLPDWLNGSLARRCSFVVSLGGVAKCVPLNVDRKF